MGGGDEGPLPMNGVHSSHTVLDSVSDFRNTNASGNLTFMDWNSFGSGEAPAQQQQQNQLPQQQTFKQSINAPNLMSRNLEAGMMTPQQMAPGGSSTTTPMPPPTSTCKSSSTGTPESQYERLIEARNADEGAWMQQLASQQRQ